MFTLTDVCRELSISPATGRNWIKLGKIRPEGKRGSSYIFSDDYVDKLKKELKAGKRSSLRSRRNKSFISGKAFYRDYISDKSKNAADIEKIVLFEADYELSSTSSADNQAENGISMPVRSRAILAEYAVRLILQRLFSPDEAALIIRECISSPLTDYLNHELTIGEYSSFVDDLIGDREEMISFLATKPIFYSPNPIYEAGEDILGLLFISLKNINLRKKAGAYYTPTNVVKRLLGNLFAASLMKHGQEKIIYDPCCGTCNFLLQLPPGIPMENLYASDIDEDSLKIARINMALKYNHPDFEFWQRHIHKANFLLDNIKPPKENGFDIILGNPPWGYSFNSEEKKYLKTNFSSAVSENPESYDLFLEKAVSLLAPFGLVSFVLPEAVLTVKSHTPVRNFLLRSTSLSHLDYLGEVFDRVQCPSVILQLERGNFLFDNPPLDGSFFFQLLPEIRDGKKSFTITNPRTLDPEYFDFLLPDEEYGLLQKIENLQSCVHLKDNAIFALGIVTGSNKEMLRERKRKGCEVILKGSDVFKYSFRLPKCYINYKPELCQQTAPMEYYRAPEKLLYRFIGNHLVFAYDDKKTLSLNSCNILIPQFKDISIKYILAVLNSRIAGYYFQKRFRSVKVLRSHLELIPIPVANKDLQLKIIAMVDDILNGIVAPQKVYDTLDRLIAEAYELTDSEYSMIISQFEGENSFFKKD